MAEFVELSHTITDGMVTFPGDPPVTIDYYMTREQAAEAFGEPASAVLDRIRMLNTSGTYIDAPVHRLENGYYVDAVPLCKLVDLEFEVVKLPQGKQYFDPESLKGVGRRGGAVLLFTGCSRTFNTLQYGKNAPWLSVEGAKDLMERGVVFVGIDAPLIDQMGSGACPVHDIILGAGGVVCENMAHLDQVYGKEKGGLFSAVPANVHMASFTVRAYVKYN